MSHRAEGATRDCLGALHLSADTYGCGGRLGRIWLELRRLPPNSPILKINTGPGPGLETLFCESWLAGISLPARECAGCASMPAGAASRYALGADGAGAARPAPAASLISASRYALGARRTALRSEGAARLCARRSRWLPSPGLALRARRRGCGRCAPGRLRQSFAASRYAHGAEGVGAARPGAYMLPPRPG